MTKQKLNVLLVQFRDDDMREHEQKCILEFGGLDPEQLNAVNALTDKIDTTALNKYDMLILGGAGSYCAGKDELPYYGSIFEIARNARERRIPTLGICFGAHLLTKAFGGELSHLPQKQEVGSFEVSLLPQAEHDPIFSKLPKKFWSQMGHKDFISSLPRGAVGLAFSERSSFQAWTFPGEMIYAIQFHPELTKDGLVQRVLYYMDKYIGDDKEALQKVMDTAKPSDEAVRVLTNFIDSACGFRSAES